MTSNVITAGASPMQMKAGKLADYLAATTEVSQGHAATPPQLMYLVEEMDDFFHREFFTTPLEMSAFAGVMVMNAYTALLGAVREALCGHVALVFPVARAALESACYAFLISQDEANADIWVRRNKSSADLKACRNTFTVDKAVTILKSIQPVMAEYVRANYDASIDYGAHPNPLSVVPHLESTGPVDEDRVGFSLTGVQGCDSWYVNRELLVCVEIAHAVAFLIAACVPGHPLLEERSQDFEAWMASKNRMADELNGAPIEYAGPMYASVRPAES